MAESPTKFILKFYYDEERFDADGIGDYTAFVGDYEEFTCIEDVEKKLLRDIRNEDGSKPKAKTVKEFCDNHLFELYERKY